ncbi:MAG: aldo/keto reductase [Elusimicrobia bacterium]|nr:aldo/keto reductase [Elusimicrobiota bacterium]
MRRRSLGRTGFKVSEVGFGGWGIGKALWGRTDDAESLKALAAALDAGIDFFDTALAYGDGHSEELIGKALKETGGTATVATKIPPKNWEWPARPWMSLARAFPPDWIVSCTERSLRHLRRDRIDLQQFHVWQDKWLQDPQWPETAAAVAGLKKAGKIRCIGVSTNEDDPDTALEVVRGGFADSVQALFNLFDQRAAESLLPLCRKMDVGVVARCPFDEGSLTGMLTPSTRFEPGDFRGHYFGGDRLAEACRRVAALGESALGPKAPTLPVAALKFALSFEAVSTVIPGMRRPAHVAQNVLAADGRYFDLRELQALAKHRWVRDFYI